MEAGAGWRHMRVCSTQVHPEFFGGGGEGTEFEKIAYQRAQSLSRLCQGSVYEVALVRGVALV